MMASALRAGGRCPPLGPRLGPGEAMLRDSHKALPQHRRSHSSRDDARFVMADMRVSVPSQCTRIIDRRQ